MKYKIAILTSHPIQYQGPLFQLLAKQPEIDLTVYFCWDFGIKKEGLDAEFGKKIKWDIPLLDGYRYKLLKNFSLRPSDRFLGQINPGIVKEIVSQKYDAILIYGWNFLTNWLAFLTAFLTKTPVFIHGENPLNQELLKSNFKKGIKKIILGWLFKQFSIFLYIGEENRKLYQYYGVPDKKLFSTPYAVDNERFIKEAEKLKRNKSELKKELGLDKKQAVILFMGKLIDKKRPFDLLKAYHQLITYNLKLKTNTALLFVGDGALRPELEKYTGENNLKNVHFVGFKNQTELPRYYALADIFVLPSGAGETWGLAVNEAMCFSLPIIVSDIVGCGPDLVKNNKNGFVFPIGDIKQLALCLGELIKDSQRRKSFGEKSLEIIQGYNYEKNIAGILTALKL